MYTYMDKSDPLRRYIRDEIELKDPLAIGRRNKEVRRVQEWLCLNGFPLLIDADFGPVTKGRVIEFQADNGLTETGQVDERTFNHLIAPMTACLRGPLSRAETLSDVMYDVAHQHLSQHPLEMGGDNMGPWVRLYMSGIDGPERYWCAGFVSFLMEQACETLDRPTPIPGSVSCDSLAAQAKMKGLFVHETERRGPIPPGSIFLRRREPWDWTHTGVVIHSTDAYFETVEGNTNDDGNRNGYEVCSRRQSYANKDFIVFDAR